MKKNTTCNKICWQKRKKKTQGLHEAIEETVTNAFPLSIVLSLLCNVHLEAAADCPI